MIAAVQIPYVLIAFRAVAGLAMVALVLAGVPFTAEACTALLALGVLSDVFDGVIARRLDCVTPLMRKLDSRCDVLFWVSAAVAAHLLHPGLLPATAPMIVVLALMEATTHAVSFARFRKEASPHHYSSKLFGLALWALLTQLLLTGEPGLVLPVAFAIGVVAQAEALAITLVLPEWRCDVSGLRAALALRRAAAA